MTSHTRRHLLNINIIFETCLYFVDFLSQYRYKWNFLCLEFNNKKSDKGLELLPCLVISQYIDFLVEDM